MRYQTKLTKIPMDQMGAAAVCGAVIYLLD